MSFCGEIDYGVEVIVFENRAIFGYTGLSVLERSRFDLWIANTISQASDGDVMGAIELVRQVGIADQLPDQRQQ